MTATDLSAPKEKRNLIQRIVSAIVLIVAVLGILQYGSPWLVFALVLAIGLIAWNEFSHLARGMQAPVYHLPGAAIIVVLLTFLFAVWNWPDRQPALTHTVFQGLPYVLPLLIPVLWMAGRARGQWGREAMTAVGVVYCGLFAGCLMLLRLPEWNFRFLYMTFFIVWMGDTVAYFVGKSIGKTKLAPDISPGKTIEGAVGNTAGGLLGAALAKLWFLQMLPWWQCLLAGLICGIIGQLGDLYESMLKRAAGAKDSGTLIPGHGGLLDRMDSLLFAGPVMFSLVYLVIRP